MASFSVGGTSIMNHSVWARRSDLDLHTFVNGVELYFKKKVVTWQKKIHHSDRAISDGFKKIGVGWFTFGGNYRYNYI